MSVLEGNERLSGRSVCVPTENLPADRGGRGGRVIFSLCTKAACSPHEEKHSITLSTTTTLSSLSNSLTPSLLCNLCKHTGHGVCVQVQQCLREEPTFLRAFLPPPSPAADSLIHSIKSKPGSTHFSAFVVIPLDSFYNFGDSLQDSSPALYLCDFLLKQCALPVI